MIGGNSEPYILKMRTSAAPRRDNNHENMIAKVQMIENRMFLLNIQTDVA